MISPIVENQNKMETKKVQILINKSTSSILLTGTLHPASDYDKKAGYYDMVTLDEPLIIGSWDGLGISVTSIAVDEDVEIFEIKK